MKRRYTLGMGMLLLVVSSAQATKVYVANEGTNSVSIFDTATNAVTGVVNDTVMPFIQPQLFAITPDNKTVYLTNNGNGTTNVGFVSIINAATNTVTGRVTDFATPTFNEPFGIAITPDGSLAYVANFKNNSVSIIDLASNAVIKQITDPTFNGPSGMAITPDGSKAYMTNFSGNSVSIIDIASNTVLATVSVGNGPVQIVITSDGTQAYVTNLLGNTVSVINLASNAVHSITGAFNFANAIALSSDEPIAYVGNEGNDTISVINTVSNVVTATINVTPAIPSGVIFTQDGTRAYVSDLSHNHVIIIDTATNTKEGSVTDVTPSVFNEPGDLILVPAPLTATQQKNKFLSQTDYINIIDWSASVSGSFARYTIYRDATLTNAAGTVSGNSPLLFKDHNRNPDMPSTYYVVGTAGAGSVRIGSVTVPGK